MFGSSRKKQASSPQRRIPTDKVVSLSSRGVPEPEIIRILKDEGYTPGEVDMAMTGALRGAVGGERAQQPAETLPDQPLSDMPPPPHPDSQDTVPQPRMASPPEAEDMRDLPSPPGDDDMRNRGPLDLPEIPGRESRYSPATPAPMSDEIPSQSQYRPGMPPEEPMRKIPERMSTRDRKDSRRRAIEELAEEIIEEKWDAVQASLLDMENRFTLIENKIGLLETSIKRLENDKKEDMDTIEEKIDTYRSAIGEVSSKMESVENAMKNSLSPLMQSVRDLSNNVKNIRENKTVNERESVE